MNRTRRFLYALMVLSLPLQLGAAPAVAQVYECPGSPPRYTNNPDHPDCEKMELSGLSIITAPISPPGSQLLFERTMQPRLFERPTSVETQSDICKMYWDWIELNQRISDAENPLTSSADFQRSAALSRIFGGVDPPNCPNR